jgi:hypothetical protein
LSLDQVKEIEKRKQMTPFGLLGQHELDISRYKKRERERVGEEGVEAWKHRRRSCM